MEENFKRRVQANNDLDSHNRPGKPRQVFLKAATAISADYLFPVDCVSDAAIPLIQLLSNERCFVTSAPSTRAPPGTGLSGRPTFH